eukprot:TRINITY_DN13629_c0_g1_i1.p1 TRINITY_DN13629_c0_g1~~TRINITY_DN13629_c0_g1_i1.p1  ORF type:complete len:224 (-),score=34.26 TRINITY_DN13629_c0_g1_i1:400-1071(-)
MMWKMCSLTYHAKGHQQVIPKKCSATLQTEEKLLLKSHPICLDPSPDVFFTMNLAHYNHNKVHVSHMPRGSYGQRTVPCRKRSHPHTSVIVPVKKKPRIDLVAFLKKVGKPPGVRHFVNVFPKIKLTDVVLIDEGKADNIYSIQQRSIEIPSAPARRLPVPNIVRYQQKYQICEGKEFVSLETTLKPNGCYDGRLRFGVLPDTVTNGQSSEILSFGNLFEHLH